YRESSGRKSSSGNKSRQAGEQDKEDSIRRDESEDIDVDKAQEETKKKTASAEYSARTTTDTRIKPSITTIPDDLYMDDETTANEQAYSSGDEVGRDHIPTINLRQSWWKPLTEDRPATPEPTWTIPLSDLTMPTNNWASALKSTYAPPPENSLLAQTGDMAIFMDWYCKRQGITHLTLRDLEGPAFEIVKVFHPDVIHLQFQMEECHKLLTDQVDDTILRYNVSKPLPLGGEPGHVTIQPDFFFNKDLEYLRYGRKVGRPALSISKMKAAYYPDVGLEQLVPDQFWIEEECKNLVVIQRVEDFQLGIESYQTQLNLTKPRWEATGFEFKHDFTVIDSPRAVIFRDRYVVQMIKRFNEIHKFSDGTLQQIDEALDYREARTSCHYPNQNAKDTTYLSESGELCGWTNPRRRLPDQEKMEMETPRSSGVNSPPNAHT
ncbi:hypothetical protein Tco_1539604, partial [Tanacetum coccineum]